MIGSLKVIRSICVKPSDAVRWACLIEATAPKAGNVFPGRDFADLTYRDFVNAAEITSAALANYGSFSLRVNHASSTISKRIGTNVNLGILLLIGPLVEADSPDQMPPGKGARQSRSGLRERVGGVLHSMTADDAKLLYDAINVSVPGGMGKSEEMDLAGPPPANFCDAMRAAASRDRIARNYANGFSDLFDVVLPAVHESIMSESDLLGGVALAHLRLLASEPDTLIARKFGLSVAREVQRRADFDHHDLDARESFDQFLRTAAVDQSGQSSNINPGTTADMIAAALYVLLRESD
ncbi:MAG: triphosphoribosyl-dephospho-CoA synthase [Planctomycetales bacterium]|nr:triphosphoribosyl-dephospho-CoA synthase [Planctomycetales bacterium]